MSMNLKIVRFNSDNDDTKWDSGTLDYICNLPLTDACVRLDSQTTLAAGWWTNVNRMGFESRATYYSLYHEFLHFEN